jgi:predicted MPP superfamily phosphohydrolase
MPSRVTRRRFLAYGTAALASAAAVDGFLLEPHRPVAEQVEIRLSRLPESFHGFRIAQISDIHFGPYMGRAGVEAAIRLAQTFRPDLVALTGDFVSHPFGHSNGQGGALFAEPCADVLSSWKGVSMVAILGNHDHWNDPEIVARALAERGIRVLRNQSLALERGRDRLWISGVDDVFEKQADLPKTLATVPPTEATLLLAHEPDFADYAAGFPVDFQLSGHSHGGQVRIPGIGPIVLPALAHKYHTGLNRAGRLPVYTSRGVGVIEPPVRLNCAPEVTLLKLQSMRAS